MIFWMILQSDELKFRILFECMFHAVCCFAPLLHLFSTFPLISPIPSMKSSRTPFLTLSVSFALLSFPLVLAESQTPLTLCFLPQESAVNVLLLPQLLSSYYLLLS